MDLWLQYVLVGAIVAGCIGWLTLRARRFFNGGGAGGCGSCSSGGCGAADGKPLVSQISLQGPRKTK